MRGRGWTGQWVIPMLLALWRGSSQGFGECKRFLLSLRPFYGQGGIAGPRREQDRSGSGRRGANNGRFSHSKSIEVEHVAFYSNERSSQLPQVHCCAGIGRQTPLLQSTVVTARFVLQKRGGMGLLIRPVQQIGVMQGIRPDSCSGPRQVRNRSPSPMLFQNINDLLRGEQGLLHLCSFRLGRGPPQTGLNPPGNVESSSKLTLPVFAYPRIFPHLRH